MGESVNCPACKPGEPCGACSAESVSTRGRPKLTDEQRRKPVTMSFSPKFIEMMDSQRGKMSQSRWIEKMINKQQTPTK